MKRIKRALKFNSAQVDAVVFLTSTMGFALTLSGAPWQALLIGLLIWPVLTFLLNLICPPVRPPEAGE